MNMKKRYIFLVLIFLLIEIPVIINLYHSYNSFENLVLDQIDETEITSIEIEKYSVDEKVVIEDPKEIEKIIYAFSDVKLRRSSALDKSTETYWISIIVNNSLRIGMNLTDTNFLYVTNLDKKDKYSSGNFRMTSDFDVNCIASLFK
ncbi:hypothetical protein NYE47_07080 [Paenibacillus sp. FSL H7-0941]|uniref:hypothetical protein n=1 Tax=Paenibacillus sp. FSL H7-0941 TaxID=2975351 RepID=UPI0030F8CE4D